MDSSDAASGPSFDLVLRNAHVIDPSQQLNQVLDVGIRDGKIAAVEPSLTPFSGAAEKDLRGKYVCPGLVDLHGHWYLGSTYGIDPDYCLNTGVTTAVDAGTTGFLNFEEFRRGRIANSETELLAYLNISAIGIPTALIGELQDLRYARPKETAATIVNHPGVLLGVKIRIGSVASADNGLAALEKAIEAAQDSSAPIMVHISAGARTPAILKRLRPGDIVTHCFQGRGDTILADDSVLAEALAARRDGIVFDVGHGSGSFCWETAKRAFEYHFLPDTISTDLHRFSAERAAIDMPTTMAKFLHLGMPLEEVIVKSTWAPARAIGRENQIGTLLPGTVADLFAFELREGPCDLEDTHSRVEKTSRRIVPLATIRNGKFIEAGSRAVPLRAFYEWDRELFRYIEETS